jgi:hypothetical protein
LAPGLFDVAGGACHVARAPRTDGEMRAADAARWICPTDAIRAARRHDDDAEPEGPDLPVSLFDELAPAAEAVRWPLADLPWAKLDRSAATPALRVVVREMAFSEHATYSATQRFLDAFGDDVELSRWIAVWFYEETRHPHVLAEWLRRVGEDLPADFALRGRVSTPFMRSPVGTLVTNVVSEITASQAYRHLARTSPEPVLRRIAALVAGDEARHAASFFRFARRQLARADASERGAERERARGLEVLHAWLGGTQQVTHPVQQMLDRLGGCAGDVLDLDFDAVRTRVVRVVGLLLDLPLRRPEDVAPALRAMLAAR